MKIPLTDLPALNRTHYAHANADVLFRDVATLEQWVRITDGGDGGTITLNCEWPNQAKIDMAKEVAKRMPVKFAVSCQPWTPNHAWTERSPLYTGPRVQKHLDFLRSGIEKIIEAGITPEVVFPYSEAFVYPTKKLNGKTLWGRIGTKSTDWPDHQEWNEAVKDKWDLVYDLYKSIVPTITVSYYNCGSVEWWRDGWYDRPNHNLLQKIDHYSCSMYEPTQTLQMVTEFRKTFENAIVHGAETAVPWLSVGRTYSHQPTGSGWAKWGNTTYPVADDWWNGQLINNDHYSRGLDGYAPWRDAPFIVLYRPEINDHFAAYCYGANGKPLPLPKAPGGGSR